MMQMRWPKTTQERRANQGEICRARRNSKNLVNAYDELWFHPQRSWKKHRLTQYKPVCSPAHDSVTQSGRGVRFRPGLRVGSNPIRVIQAFEVPPVPESPVDAFSF